MRTQTRRTSKVLPSPKPGLKGSNAIGEVYMSHFPEVQLEASMEASEGHKDAVIERKPPRCLLCPSAGVETRDLCAKQIRSH